MEPMTCREAKPRVSRYADGELPGPEAAALRAHLIDCPRCRARVSEIASVRRFFEDPEGDAVRAPSRFAERVTAAAFAGAGAALAEPARSAALPFARRIAAVAAAVALLAGGVILARQGFFDRSPDALEAQDADAMRLRIRDRFERTAPVPSPQATAEAEGNRPTAPK